MPICSSGTQCLLEITGGEGTTNNRGRGGGGGKAPWATPGSATSETNRQFVYYNY